MPNLAFLTKKSVEKRKKSKKKLWKLFFTTKISLLWVVTHGALFFIFPKSFPNKCLSRSYSSEFAFELKRYRGDSKIIKIEIKTLFYTNSDFFAC